MSKKDIKFYFLVLIGAVISMTALLTPPLGQVDNSVLLLLGELSILIGALYNCSMYLNVRRGIFAVGKDLNINEIKKDVTEPTENKEIQ